MARATRDFEELLECLTRHGVKFVIVGAHAVAHHARPRYTKDLDLFVEPDGENGRKIVAAIEEFGFAGLGITSEDFAVPGRILQLGMPPNRVDLLTSIDGVGFAEAWETRAEGLYGKTKVPFIGFDALIRNKKSASRPQDLADLQILERSRSS